MRTRTRIVVDTNALVSRLLLPTSVPGQAVRKAVDNCILLVSEATMNELADVLARPKFDRYISLEDRQQFLRLLGRLADFVPIVYPVHACRDPRDDKFLEVALNGKADLIVTGDADLLALHPWQGIAILSPGSYLKG
jgi:putative PIN family toxin of toxin-antitoxin system